MRIVLDTNCLIQCLSPHSAFFAVWESFLNGQNTLCVTTDILFEYREILPHFFSTELSEAIVNTIANAPFVVHIDPNYRFNLIETDPDDNKFVDCAVVAGARYIVTNDHHFNILRELKFPLIQIITLKDFLCLLTPLRS
jgi:putative PIN family toxin of toxin-antitoxin system